MFFGGGGTHNRNSSNTNTTTSATTTTTNKGGGGGEKVVVPRTFKLLEELEAGEKGTGVNSHHCSLGLADDGEKSIIFVVVVFIRVREDAFTSSRRRFRRRRFLVVFCDSRGFVFRFREKRDLSFSSLYCFWYSISELTR
jgi:hypothetical protein